MERLSPGCKGLCGFVSSLPVHEALHHQTTRAVETHSGSTSMADGYHGFS